MSVLSAALCAFAAVAVGVRLGVWLERRTAQDIALAQAAHRAVYEYGGAERLDDVATAILTLALARAESRIAQAGAGGLSMPELRELEAALLAARAQADALSAEGGK